MIAAARPPFRHKTVRDIPAEGHAIQDGFSLLLTLKGTLRAVRRSPCRSLFSIFVLAGMDNNCALRAESRLGSATSAHGQAARHTDSQLVQHEQESAHARQEPNGDLRVNRCHEDAPGRQNADDNEVRDRRDHQVSTAPGTSRSGCQGATRDRKASSLGRTRTGVGIMSCSTFCNTRPRNWRRRGRRSNRCVRPTDTVAITGRSPYRRTRVC